MIPLPVLEVSSTTIITRSHIQDDTYFTASDLNEFDKYVDTLPNPTFPDISSYVKFDGSKRSVERDDCNSKVNAADAYKKNILNTGKEKPMAVYNPLSYLPRFVLLFFIFFFLQVIACLLTFEEEEDIPLLEVSTSSILFS